MDKPDSSHLPKESIAKVLEALQLLGKTGEAKEPAAVPEFKPPEEDAWSKEIAGVFERHLEKARRYADLEERIRRCCEKGITETAEIQRRLTLLEDLSYF